MTETAGNIWQGWTPSVYYSEILIDCPIDKAWKFMLDYEAWNPTFVGAEVVPVKGKARTEGELVLIRKSLKDIKGEPLPEFYAETVKVVPHRHIVWYVYPKGTGDFRNFVDFGLSEEPSGVKFSVYYYAQNRIAPELLSKEREATQKIHGELAAAFKKYCETH
jgi:hypothetical protein